MALTLTPSKVLKFIANFEDHEGKHATTIAWRALDITTGTPPVYNDTLDILMADLTAWATAVDALSNARLRSTSFAWEFVNDVTYPDVTGWYPNIEDKLFVVFASNDTGRLYKAMIPAPANTDFMTDQETINAVAVTGDASVLAYKSLIETHVNATVATSTYVTNNGDGHLKLQSGIMERKKNRRKLRAGVWTEIGG